MNSIFPVSLLALALAAAGSTRAGSPRSGSPRLGAARAVTPSSAPAVTPSNAPASATQSTAQQAGPPTAEGEVSPENGPSLGGLPADELARLFEAAGVHLDLDAGLLSIPATVEVRSELLEYLLVSPHGAVHESLFQTRTDARLLNTALLALGAAPGRNAIWYEKEELPDEAQLRAGISPYEIGLPEGDAFYLYAGWRIGDEVFFYRVEDLLRDLANQRGMRRHAWVYLGSRMAVRGTEGIEQFAAAAEGNLINIAFFSSGNTLLTAALVECVDQTIWMGNPWLLPPSHREVRFVFSKQRLETVPAPLLERLPELPGPASPEDASRDESAESEDGGR